MTPVPLTIAITYDPVRLTGRFECSGGATSSMWERLTSRVLAIPTPTNIAATTIDLPWPDLLSIVREFGTKQTQQTLNFRFAPSGEALLRIRQFMDEVRKMRSAQNSLTAAFSEVQI